MREIAALSTLQGGTNSDLSVGGSAGTNLAHGGSTSEVSDLLLIFWSQKPSRSWPQQVEAVLAVCK